MFRGSVNICPFQLMVTLVASALRKRACRVRPFKSVHGWIPVTAGPEGFDTPPSFAASACDSGFRVFRGSVNTCPFQSMVTLAASALRNLACRVRPFKSIQACNLPASCPAADRARKRKSKDMVFIMMQVYILPVHSPMARLRLRERAPRVGRARRFFRGSGCRSGRAFS